jgi:hypothetical protein
MILLPEGAEFTSSSRQDYRIAKTGLSVSIIFTESDISEFTESHFTLTYRYLFLWLIFRPSLWIGTGVAIFVIFLYLRKTLKPKTKLVKRVPKDVIRRFLSIYEERRRILLDLQSFERKVRQGKISRRRHKMLRKSLDGRLSRIQRSLNELRKQIGAGSRQHNERMKQLETSEAEIETLNHDIERVETRYRRKELSVEARRKLLDEYKRIKERAENTIDEILLRLQEEIH